jgi:lytic murein transglycosylase
MRLSAGIATLAAVLAMASPVLAQECGGSFSQWKSQIEQEAIAAGVGQRGLQALANARVDDRVLQRDRGQRFFTQTFIEVTGRLISNDRLQRGRQLLQQHADLFQRAEREYGVPGAVITAFWALETDFGAVQGDFNTLNAIVTLAHDCRRPELFRRHVVPLLQLIDRGDLPADVQGAWAGEIGQTQMLPADILELGVDGDGNGSVDIRRSVPDVILTTANKIRHRGWRAGEPWMEEVRIPADIPWEETGRSNRLPISQWSDWGVTRNDGSPLDAGRPDAGLALPQGHRGPAFLLYPNFDVYLEWNQSFIYTLTAGHLANRLAGAPAFDRRSPEAGLDRDQMMQLQRRLESLGYDVGGIDGILGVMTREAVRQEQQRLGLPMDGWPTPALLSRL